jgi:hypothetical protein
VDEAEEAKGLKSTADRYANGVTGAAAAFVASAAA